MIDSFRLGRTEMDDITYCASDCECINCYHNKANITNYDALHSWMRKEEIEDCPFNSEDEE